MFKIIRILAMRLSTFDGVNLESLTTLHSSSQHKGNTRYTVKLSRVSFCDLIIPSPYRWLVKHLAQLQVTLVGSDNCPYWTRERFPSGAFSFSLLLGVFFSLSFKIINPLRNNAERLTNNH